jgi:hypothetical protein
MAHRKDLNLDIIDESVDSTLRDFLQMAKDMGCDISNINYPEMPYVEQWCTTNDIYFT